MPITPTAKQYRAWEPGSYDVTLTDIRETMVKFQENEDEQERYQFTFVLTSEKGHDDPRPLFISTGRNYGSKRSTFTKFLDGIVGARLDLEDVVRFDLEKLVGSDFELIVTKEVSNNGVESNKPASIKRKKGPKVLDLGPFLVPQSG